MFEDTNSTSLDQLVNWLFSIRIGGGTVINNRAVSRTDGFWYVQGCKKALSSYEAARRLAKARF